VVTILSFTDITGFVIGAGFFYLITIEMKILVATQKPFAQAALDQMNNLFEEAHFHPLLIENYKREEELHYAIERADALIVRSDIVTSQLLECAPNLKVVVRAGAGYDNIDLDACSKRGVVVMNTPGQNANSVAELAIGMMIFSARNHFSIERGKELSGCRLGIHGYGHIGHLVAQKGSGLGLRTYGYDLDPSNGQFERDNTIRMESVEELYRVSDFLSLHLPATDNTKGVVTKQLLNLLPKGASIINTARKEIIDQEGLIEIMEEREDLRYLTDTPCDKHSLMVERFGNRIWATPKKIGAETAQANNNAAIAAAKQVLSFFKEGSREYQVNR